VSKLARNIGYNVGGQLALVALTFVAAKFVFGHLGSDALGLIYFAQIINGLVIAAVGLGIGTLIVREVSANARDQEHVRRLVRSGAAFAWSAYAAFALLLVAAAPWIVDHWIVVEQLDRGTAIVALRILSASTLLTIPLTFYGSVFRGLQAMGPPNVVDVGGLLVQHAGTAVLAYTGHGIQMVACWIAATYVCRIAVITTLAAGIFSWRGLIPAFDASPFRRVKRDATHMLGVSLLGIVHTQTDKLIISRTLPITGIGLYGVIASAVGRGGVLCTAVLQGALPVFSELVAEGRRAELLRQSQRFQTLICYGLVPFYALVSIGSRILFSNMFGADTAGIMIAPAYLLALGFYLNSAMSVPYYVALADNRTDLVMRFSLTALVVTLPVTAVLTWQLGFVGAGIAWVWYQVFAHLAFVPKVCRTSLGVPIARWYANIAEPVVVTAASYGVAAVILHLVAPGSFAMFAVTYSAASVVFLAMTWWRIGPETRRELVQGLQGLISRP
jgi:O-antigen/teichoic acid export membrane protein